MTVLLHQLQLFDKNADDQLSVDPEETPASPKKHSLKIDRHIHIQASLGDDALGKIMASLTKQVKKLDAQANISTKNAQTETSWFNSPFLCIDTETSGLDRNHHRVIEVAWVLFHSENQVEESARLCSIGQPLDQEITSLTGISNEMLANEPPFSAHVDSMLAAMKKASFVVAYNANFDKQFLESELARVDKSLPDIPWIDPCVFVREIDKYQKGKRLSDAAMRWGVDLKEAHRALADAKATGRLLYKLAPRLKIQTLSELINQQARWQQEQEQSYKAYVARKQAMVSPHATPSFF